MVITSFRFLFKSNKQTNNTFKAWSSRTCPGWWLSSECSRESSALRCLCLLDSTLRFPVPHLRHFFPYLEGMVEPRVNTAAFAELCQCPALCCWRSLSPNQDVKQFYISSKPLSASWLYFSNPSPSSYVLIVQAPTLCQTWISMGIFPARDEERKRKSGSVPAACPQGSSRAGTWPLSCAFAARLCLCCRVTGTHMEDSAQECKGKGRSSLSRQSDSQNEETWLNLPFQGTNTARQNPLQHRESCPCKICVSIQAKKMPNNRKSSQEAWTL